MASAKIIAEYVVNVGGSGYGGSGGGGSTTTSLADRATLFAGFGSPILPGTDFGTRHIVLQPSTPVALYAYIYEPPASGDFIFDVESTNDGGVTWESILTSPVVIPPGFAGPTICTLFASGVSLAPGNMLRLAVIAAGDGPEFSNGFSCVIQLQGTSIPGWDRATFAFGFTGNVPINQDIGGYFIATRPATPSVLYCNVKSPPVSDTYLDIQAYQGDEWTSIFPSPLLIPGGVNTLISTTEFASITISPGNLLRPILTSGPILSGMGYNVSLEMEVTNT